MDKNFYVPKKEWMTYCIGALGQGMIYAIMSSYISDFYLNVLKVTPIFVLLLMLFARIWDAINDPIMGYIMDRANPKKGKMKPYILYTPIPVAILTLLLFYAPNLSDSKKMIYAAITYIAWGMIYTASEFRYRNLAFGSHRSFCRLILPMWWSIPRAVCWGRSALSCSAGGTRSRCSTALIFQNPCTITRWRTSRPKLTFSNLSMPLFPTPRARARRVIRSGRRRKRCCTALCWDTLFLREPRKIAI